MISSIRHAQRYSWSLLFLAAASMASSAQAKPHSQAAHRRAAAPAKPAPRNAVEDDLAEHLKAAETFQIAQDWAAVERENRAAASIALRGLGSLDLRTGKLEDAELRMRESLALVDDSATRTDLAIVLMREQKPDAALEQVNAALAKDDKSGRAQHVAGKIEYMQGHYAEAVAHLEKAVVLTPDPEAAYTLGMGYLRLNNLERASLLFEEMELAAKDKAGAHVLFARAYRQTDHFQQAVEHLKKAVAIDPETPRVHFLLGLVYLLEHDMAAFPMARQQFLEESRRHPEDYYSHYFLGMMAAMEKDYAAATPELLKATALRPSEPDGWLYLGQAQFETGNMKDAEADLRKAVELTKDVSRNSYQIQRAHFMLSRMYAKTGHKEESEKEVAISAELRKASLANAREVIGDIVNSREDPASFIRTAAQQTSEADSEEATGSSFFPEKALSKDEEQSAAALRARLSTITADCYNNLGVLSARLGDPATAIQQLSQAAKWNPGLAGVNKNLGILAFKSQDYDRAAPALAAALRAQPGDPLVRRMLAMTQYLQNDFAAAAQTLQPIAAELYADPVLVSAYGNSLARAHRGDEARKVFEKVAADNPQSADAQFAAAQGLSAAEAFDEALVRFQRASELRPRLAQAHYGAGQCLIRLHRLPEAAQEFRKELDLDPTNASARYHLAYVLLETQQTGEARKLLEALVADDPGYANAQYQLGKLLLDAGEVKGAIPHLERASQIDPGREYSHYQLSIAYRKDGRAAEADRELKTYQQIKATQRNRPIPGMQEPVSGAAPSN